VRVFEDITLSWGGQTYTIPSDRVMPAIARVEEIVTLVELIEMSKKPRLSVIAEAYATVLRLAGASVTTEEVYAGMFSGAQGQIAVAGSLRGLLSMMIPPSAVDKLTAQGSEEAPPPPAGKKITPADKSSKRPIRRR